MIHKKNRSTTKSVLFKRRNELTRIRSEIRIPADSRLFKKITYTPDYLPLYPLRYAITITTTPKRSLYLNQTLKSLNLAKFPKESIVIVADQDKYQPNLEKPTAQGYKIIYNTKKHGQMANMHKAFSYLATQSVDYYIYFEDDILLSLNSFLEMDRWLQDDLHKPKAMLSLSYPWGCHNVKDKSVQWIDPHFFGLMGVIFHPEIIKKYLNSKNYEKARGYGIGGDLHIGQFAHQESYPVLSRYPPLLTHVGEVSNINSSYYPTPFIGEHTDALSIVPK